MARISKVGFEIEGGWDGEPFISPFEDISLVHDNSINGQTLASAPRILAQHVGEAVSPPIEVEGKWKEWLVDHWPNAAPANRTNRTCGLHIHISLKSLRDYSLLGSKSFLYGVKEEMMDVGKKMKLPKKHVFWERMEGANSFAPIDFDAAQQMRVTQKGGRNRYGWLNFAWAMHGTVEFRALPTFRDSKVAVAFVSRYLNFVEEWLDENQEMSLSHSASLRI